MGYGNNNIESTTARRSSHSKISWEGGLTLFNHWFNL